jgi:hypothetical protein
LGLREGSIYYFVERRVTSPESHYFIVVNHDPLTQRVLLLAVLTSNIRDAKRRRASSLGTLVEFTPAASNVFTKECVADCNDLMDIPLIEFNERFVAGEIKYFDKDLSLDDRRALRKAIHASDLVAPEMKALVAKA